MIKVDLLEKVRFPWKPGGGEGVSQTDLVGRAFQAKDTARAEVPWRVCAVGQ